MKNNDLFAFPVPGEEIKKTIDLDGNKGTIFRNGYNGMTLRDYFAGQALVGIMSTTTIMPEALERLLSSVPKLSYALADAMLAEREKGEGR